jgi:acyl-CoA thioesterase-2
VLTYASDYTLLDASLHRHGRTWLDPALMVASIDHILWFHRPFRADEWLLYVTESPSASSGRGLNFGRVFTQDGTMVASVAQESLMRERDER